MIQAASFSARTRDDYMVCAVRGEVDMATAPGLRRDLTAAVPNTARGVVVDLSEVHYLDSAGIRVLFEMAEMLHTRRQQLRLVVAEDAPIHTVLHLVDMQGSAPIHATIDDALAAAESAATDPLEL